MGWLPDIGARSFADDASRSDIPGSQSARHFLKRRHKVLSRGTGRFSDKAIFGEFGVAKLTTPARAALPHAST